MDTIKKSDLRAEAMTLALIGHENRPTNDVIARAKAFADFMIEGIVPSNNEKKTVAVIIPKKVSKK